MSTGVMSRRMSPGTRTRIAIAGAVVVIVLIVLAATGGFSGSSALGNVSVVTTSVAPQSPNAQMDPFGAPKAAPDYTVPPPPGEPGLIPTIATKTTIRLYGANPYQEAVSVTQHVWPAALPENAPNENNNDPDRPWGVTLVTPNDPLTAITAVRCSTFPTTRPFST